MTQNHSHTMVPLEMSILNIYAKFGNYDTSIPLNFPVKDIETHKVGWLGFNGTFTTNRPHRAIKSIKVC